MGTPWGYGPNQFDVEAGKASLVQLNVIHRGTIRNFNLRVAGGTTGSFAIYSSENAARQAVADANSETESVSVDVDPANYIVYEGTLTSGVFTAHELRVRYINRDGTPTNPVPRLWMLLKPDGSGQLPAVIGMVIDGADL